MAKTFRIDLTEFKHPNGLLTAKKFSHINKDGQAIWDCVCDCGKEVKVACWLIHNGHVRSCGCIRKQGKLYTCYGESKTILNWSSDPRCKVEYYVLRNRLYIGWDFENALTTPLTRNCPKRSNIPAKKIAPSGRGVSLKELLKAH